MYPAKQSPRTCDDGTLRWYCGDTFSIRFNFIFKDASGYPVEPEPTDSLDVVFTNVKNEEIASFHSTGTNYIDINVDETLTAKFKEGVYNIEAKFNGDYVTTLLHNSKVVVE